MSNHPEEKKCPICLDILSKHNSCVFAGHQDSCIHEPCFDCLNDYFGHVLAENDYISPVTFECPVCKTEYLVFEGIWEIIEPVTDADFFHGELIDLTNED